MVLTMGDQLGCNVADKKVETLAEWSAWRSVLIGAARMVPSWAAQWEILSVGMTAAIGGQQWDDGRALGMEEYEVGN